MLVAPIAHVDRVDQDTANNLLVAWGHQMGPIVRGNNAGQHHALFVMGEPVAIAVQRSLGGDDDDWACMSAHFFWSDLLTHRTLFGNMATRSTGRNMDAHDNRMHALSNLDGAVKTFIRGLRGERRTAVTSARVIRHFVRVASEQQVRDALTRLQDAEKIRPCWSSLNRKRRVIVWEAA